MVLELTRGIDGLVGAGCAVADLCQMLTVVCLVRHMVAGAAMGCHCLAKFGVIAGCIGSSGLVDSLYGGAWMHAQHVH